MGRLAELKEALDRYVNRAARMRLLGEDKRYRWEYTRCLEAIHVHERLIARHRSSSIKGTASDS